MNIMSREKKPQVDDLTKLRRILDNSSDPTLESLLAKNEKALESVRRRLRGDSTKAPSQFDRIFSRSVSMEPKVNVRELTPITPRLITPVPKVEPPAPLPEFTLVPASESAKQIPPQELPFESEELFEVEKVEKLPPQFLEVTPKEPVQPSQETEQPIQNDGASVQEPESPEWQPVKGEKQDGPVEPHEQPAAQDIPEFEPVIVPTTPEKLEKPIENEPAPQEQKPVETPVAFLPTEPSEPSVQRRSKWEKRQAKREQRAKEKEEKRRKKLELKRLKKEEQEKERESKQIMEQQPPLLPPDEEAPATSEPPTTVETAWIKVDLDAFKGIKCIDEKTAELLYTHGYFSIENIKDATLNDLVEIRGMRRKLAKQIKKEIEQKLALTENQEFVPIKQKTTKKKLTHTLQDAAEWESYPAKETPTQPSPSVCTYKGYTLYKRETTRSGKKTTIHFFSKKKPEKGVPSKLPKGYQIAINKKTRVPYLKKTK